MLQTTISYEIVSRVDGSGSIEGVKVLSSYVSKDSVTVDSTKDLNILVMDKGRDDNQTRTHINLTFVSAVEDEPYCINVMCRKLVDAIDFRKIALPALIKSIGALLTNLRDTGNMPETRYQVRIKDYQQVVEYLGYTPVYEY